MERFGIVFNTEIGHRVFLLQVVKVLYHEEGAGNNSKFTMIDSYRQLSEEREKDNRFSGGQLNVVFAWGILLEDKRQADREDTGR
jgi:hypothetical protein